MKKITTLFAYILPFFIAAQTPNSTEDNDGGNALKGDTPFDVVLQLDPNKKNNKWGRNLKLMDLMENSPKGITNNHL